MGGRRKREQQPIHKEDVLRSIQKAEGRSANLHQLLMMGGRLAEELFLNTMTTGAGNDIEQATELARKMVCQFGMSSLGPLTSASVLLKKQ